MNGLEIKEKNIFYLTCNKFCDVIRVFAIFSFSKIILVIFKALNKRSYTILYPKVFYNNYL